MHKQKGCGKCSLCGSLGTSKITCPLNPKAKNPNPKKHQLAKKSYKKVKPKDSELLQLKGPGSMPKPVIKPYVNTMKINPMKINPKEKSPTKEYFISTLFEILKENNLYIFKFTGEPGEYEVTEHELHKKMKKLTINNFKDFLNAWNKILEDNGSDWYIYNRDDEGNDDMGSEDDYAFKKLKLQYEKDFPKKEKGKPKTMKKSKSPKI